MRERVRTRSSGWKQGWMMPFISCAQGLPLSLARGARVRRSARPAGVRTRYRLSNSRPLGLGLDVSTGTSVPATSCGVSSTQSWIMSGYLPACVAGVGLLPSAVPVHASCARQGRYAWQKSYKRNGAQAKDVCAREPAVRSKSGACFWLSQR